MIARHLIAAAYPIAHDEGCYLDPEFGEQNFQLYVDMELYDEEDEDFDIIGNLRFMIGLPEEDS